MLRWKIADLRKAASGDSNDAEIEAAHEVAALFEELDGWLSQGGFRPAEWTG